MTPEQIAAFDRKLDTLTEKVGVIHDEMVMVKSEMIAARAICAERHINVDARIGGLHRVVKGNGQPGLEGKHQDLERRFTGLEARVMTWASIAVILGEILTRILSKKLGWG